MKRQYSHHILVLLCLLGVDPAYAHHWLIIHRAHTPMTQLAAYVGIKPLQSLQHQGICRPKQSCDVVILLDARAKALGLVGSKDRDHIVVMKSIDNWQLQVHKRAMIEHIDKYRLLIVHGLFHDARLQGLSPYMLKALMNIFSFGFDLDHGLKPGDVITYLTSRLDVGLPLLTPSMILYASVNHGHHAHQVITWPDHYFERRYYDEHGQVVCQPKRLNPVVFKRKSSLFSQSRWHPILNNKRPHYGVDLVAKRGAIVRAVADGQLIKVMRTSGYGNVVMIRHDHYYETRYAHLDRFARAMRVGQHVHAGQVVGYVGQTGLATGPHLHFEMRYRHQPIDPYAQHWFSNKPLVGSCLKAFNRHVNRLMQRILMT